MSIVCEAVLITMMKSRQTHAKNALTHLDTQTHTHTHEYTHIHTHTHIYTRTHTHTNTHTPHTHTHIHSYMLKFIYSMKCLMYY